MTSHRPIFLVGCPRSGTTLLQLMLHAHPRLAVPPENRYVLPAYYDRAQFGDLTEAANRAKLAAFVTGKKSLFKDFGLEGKAVRKAIADGPPTLGSGLEIVMRSFADASGAARWCDKRPMYVRHVRILQRMFPDAQFIHLIRDGRACASSLMRMPWFDGDLGRAIGTWTLAMEYADRARRRLDPDSWFDLHYEKLLTEPEFHLRRLCAFLGEDFDAAMLDPGEVKDSLVPERKSWHDNTAGPITTDRVESWQRELSAPDIRFVNDVAGRRLRAQGYVVESAGQRDTARLARYAAAHARRWAGLARTEAADQLVIRRGEPAVASLFTEAQRASR
ncbi:MAG: sulfotransferase family protein [Sporichthyaceae bacterium]